MKTATILGLALIMLGIVAFTYQGITYTTREKVIDLGPLQATVDKKETIPLTPLVGGLALVGGIMLLIGGARRASLSDDTSHDAAQRGLSVTGGSRGSEKP